MTYRQCETSREIRLWITQVVIPAAAIGVTAMTIPEVRERVFKKKDDLKESIEKKFKKN